MFLPKSEELEAIGGLARRFARRELAANVQDRDRYPFGEFFRDVLDRACEAGFLGVVLPGELGGGGDAAALCEILQNVCEIDASLGGVIFTNALSQALLAAAGSSALVREISAQAAAAGERLIAFPAYLDPARAGALPGAWRDGIGYRLGGRLELLVLGNLARQAVVPARTGRGPQYSFFRIDLAGAGVAKSDPVFTLGLHACPAVDVILDAVEAELVGEENAGGRYFDETAPAMNTAAAAMNAGIMRGAFNAALAYSRERRQGGRPIAQWSEVGMLLAEMAIKTEAAAMCVDQARLELARRKGGWKSRVLAAGLHVHELACACVGEGIQVLGGYGYMKDFGQEKRYRDARMVQALGGAAPMKKLDVIRPAVDSEKRHCMRNLP